MKSTKKKLTEKEKKFCVEYMLDLNATQAAIRAGYSEKTAKNIASQNLAKLHIQDEIQGLRSDQSKRTLVDADYVLTRLMKVAETCMAEHAVESTDDFGETSYVKKFEHSGANRALELLGKHLGLFTERLHVDSSTIPELKVTIDTGGD